MKKKLLVLKIVINKNMFSKVVFKLPELRKGKIVIKGICSLSIVIASLALLFPFSLVSCQQRPTNQYSKIDSLHLSYNKELNDIARFVAGYGVDSTSSLSSLANLNVYKKYQKDLQDGWVKFDKVAEKYKSFAKSEIVPPYDTVSTLFYPFSGPDFLFANILFPNVKKIIMMGLEKPGSIPTFPSSRDSLSKVLELYKSSIEDVIHLSFFRTLDMNKELANHAIDGTLPVLLLFLSRSGMYINDINYFKLADDGKPLLLDYKAHKNADAVEIKYFNSSDTSLRSLIYLSTNVADPALKSNKPFYNYLNNIDRQCVTFVKSATYLMHKSYFSIIRNTCLNHSILILQDDSGIGYKYFDKNIWDIQLYGKYTRPIKLFEEFYEPDYYNAFQTSKVKPLNFRIGYSNPSNLLMAKRKIVKN
jgi:hypothetical protein